VVLEDCRLDEGVVRRVSLVVNVVVVRVLESTSHRLVEVRSWIDRAEFKDLTDGASIEVLFCATE
jgi:hypothetical protein